jgi:hypothetical protein
MRYALYVIAVAAAAQAAGPVYGACPGVDGVGRIWVEHAGEVPSAEKAAHLSKTLQRAEVTWIKLGDEVWWIGAARRGREAPVDGDCRVLGSAALYVIGWGDDPELDFEAAAKAGGEAGLGGRLIELRWYDEATGEKHRWFNAALAERLGWRSGHPAATTSPLPLPSAIDELL